MFEVDDCRLLRVRCPKSWWWLHMTHTVILSPLQYL